MYLYVYSNCADVYGSCGCSPREKETERDNTSWRREEEKEMGCENEKEKENCEKRRRQEGVKKS